MYGCTQHKSLHWHHWHYKILLFSISSCYEVSPLNWLICKKCSRHVEIILLLWSPIVSSVSYTSALVVILHQQRRPNVQLQYLRNGSITLSEDTRYWQGSMLKCNMLKCNMDKQDRGLAALLWCLAYMLHTHYILTFRKISWLCILVQWRHIQHFSNKEGGGGEAM